MSQGKRAQLLSTVSVLAGLLVTGAAQAQAPQAAGEGEGATVGDVIVTARRREEKLRDVPVSASVFSGELLRARGDLGEPMDVLNSVPGLKYSDTSAPSTSEITLRGSGAGRGSGGDASVGLYRDDAYIGGGAYGSRTFSRLDLLDVEQIQVLRGPQGALYGRNSVGGALNLTSTKPRFEQSGYVNLNFQAETYLKQIQMAVNQQLSDEVAVRFSGEWFDQPKGSFINTAVGQYSDQTKGYAVRGQIRYRHENLDVTFLAENAFYYLPPLHRTLTIPAGTAGYPAAGFIQDPYTLHTNTSFPFEQGFKNYSLKIRYDFEFASLTSITASRARKSHNFNDTDLWDPVSLAAAKLKGIATATADASVSLENQENWQGFYQGVHLDGKKIGAFTWLAGAEFFTFDSDIFSQTGRTPTTANRSPGTYSLSDPSYDSWAVFGSVGYDFTDQLNGEFDIRYTADERHSNAATRDKLTNVLNATTALVNGAASYDKVSYSASLSYRITPGWLTYARVATGYRTGNFNGVLSDPRAPRPSPVAYGPENATSFEIGAKGNLTPSIFMTAAAYQTEVEDAQSQTTDGCAATNPVCPVTGQAYLVNAGTTKAWGVEVEATGNFIVLDGALRASAGLSWQKGEFQDGALKGLTLPMNPEWIGVIELDYRHAFVADTTLFGNISASTQSGGTLDTDFNLPLIDRTLVDARVGIDFGQLELGAYVKNATDERYAVFYVPTSTRYSNPRLYGVTARYKW